MHKHNKLLNIIISESMIKTAPTLDEFPVEILFQIHKYLDFVDLLNLSETCKRFHEIVTKDKKFKHESILRIHNQVLKADDELIIHLIESGAFHFNVELSNVQFIENFSNVWEYLGPFIRSLAIKNCMLTESWVSLFENLPNLCSIKFYVCTNDSDFGDKLKEISQDKQYNHLTEIKMLNNDISDYFYEFLSLSAPNLKSIIFPHTTPISQNAAALIKNVRYLENIVINDSINNNLNQNDLLECANNSLKSLTIYKSYVHYDPVQTKDVLLRRNDVVKYHLKMQNDIQLRYICDQTKLHLIEHLVLYSYNNFSNLHGLEEMQALTHLEIHSQVYQGWVNFNFGPITLPKVKHLTLDYGSGRTDLMSTEAISSIVLIFPNLEELDMGFCNSLGLTYIFNSSFSTRLKILKIFNFRQNMKDKPQVEIFRDLNKLINLEVLEMKNYRFTLIDNVLGNVLSSRKLRRLSIWRADEITDDGILRLTKNCPNLEELELVCLPKITNRAIEFVTANLFNLKLLNISYCRKLDKKCLNYIATNCKSLKKIYVPDSFLSDAKKILPKKRKLQIY